MKESTKVKKENFIAIQGWMVSELGLKGNELLIYAIIFGFSQNGESRFVGSLKYLCDWTNSTKSGVSKCLQSLVLKGYLVKTDIIKSGVKFCEYHTTKYGGVYNKVGHHIQQSDTGGIQQSGNNNIALDNIEENIDNNIVLEKSKSFKNFTLEDFQNEIKLNRGAANFTAQDCIDFHDYWTETDANGKMRFTREITWNTDKRMLRWKKNDRTQINGQKTSTKTTKEDVMNGGKDLLLKYAELERQKMGNKE